LWQDDRHRAAKLHLEMDIFNHVPTAAVITDGNGNEKKILRTFLAPDTIYLIDAGYAEYKLLGEIIAARSSFVIRLRDNADYVVLEEKPLTESDIAAGVQKDLIVTLGCKSKQNDCPQPLRITQVFHKGNENDHRPSRVSSKKTFRTKEVDYTLLLATDRMDLPAETISLLFTRSMANRTLLPVVQMRPRVQPPRRPVRKRANHPSLLRPDREACSLPSGQDENLQKEPSKCYPSTSWVGPAMRN